MVYVGSIACPSCGLQASGYMQDIGGEGVTICSRCGATIRQALPAHPVVQLAPSGHESPLHPHMHASHFAGLYVQPKRTPRLRFADIARAAYSPSKTFQKLYLSTDLRKALALVILFTIVSVLVSTLVTANASALLRYDTTDALVLAFRSFVSGVVIMLAFLVYGLAAALVAKDVFGGRGERATTITLLGYCYPSYVILSVVALVIFDVGFSGLKLSTIHLWTDAEWNQAIVESIVLLVVIVVGLVWLTWMAAKAISVSNDISTGEAVLAAVLAVIPAGIIFVLAGAMMPLPIGLFP